MSQIFDESTQTWVDEADPQNSDFTTSGADLLEEFNEPDARVGYTNPDPTAKQVGVDTATGNPIWQLLDAGGNILQWAVDRFGNAVGLQNLGPAAPVDARLTYKPTDSRVTSAGVDKATGNPLFQLIDEGGNLIQYAINAAGQAIGIQNLGKPSSGSGAASVVKPTSSTGILNTGGGATNILKDILTGDGGNSGGSPLNIINQTDNRPVTNTNIDASVRNTTNTSTNINTNVNSPDLVSNVVKSIASLFQGGNAPLQASTAVSPLNDSIFGSAQTPASRQSGMSLDGSRMAPGTRTSAIATLKETGAGSNAGWVDNRLIIFGAIASIVALFFLFRRGK